ncbi:transcription termination factor Rho [Mycobacterium sp. SMC-4]|uniref:transcription termination factor Rho n=1 Tax=Mycobacterium sp. SMC-4 TaxID=2857059 RepID=UPI0021B2300F|nr:transcription termination factor Rho [Mycobacterium sp. SMC-4]UXA16733.1 transcription termination factor Rho [Mycobacterium sp. SMC-4]
MTDTDLITAGDSANSGELPTSVSPEVPPSTGDSAAPAAARRGGALTSMVLPELRALAKELGIDGASGMRKGDLVAAIRERRGSTSNGAPAPSAPAGDASAAESGDTAQAAEAPAAQAPRRERRGASRDQGKPGGEQGAGQSDGGQSDGATSADSDKSNRVERGGRGNRDVQDAKADRSGDTSDSSEKADRAQKSEKSGNDSDNRSDGDQQGGQNRGRADNNRSDTGDDDGEGRQGRRGRRFRDRRRRERGGEGGGNAEAELRDDDVVQPVAGILDVLDNYAFVRTSGYLAGPNDVYVSMNMVRKNGLRRGDAVTGAVRVPKEGDSGGGQNPRQKFNPLVRLDSVNGKPVEEAKKRPEFNKLTPLYPNQRLRLETSGDKLTTRVIDLIMPIGKGQRALIVSPPKAGKTTIMQDIANAITRNNPECHLMVVLVDERPEEVTDMQRSVKGEVIASTFDRPPSDHTQAAELAIERAKRLVEQGKDVVVLLDSITRLGRAYNNASPASGRILSGGVDSTALYPPKRFLGAARNIEEGGSLTIIATAMVETGSTGDTVIFEEFKGTGNAELKLDRKIAERRVFPAVDVNPSGTRKDELLLSPDEFAIVHKLRRVLSGLDPHQAIDLLMSQLRKTKNNYEFLVQVSKNTPGGADVD